MLPPKAFRWSAAALRADRPTSLGKTSFNWTPCTYKSFLLPTDAQENCFQRSVKTYIKITIAPACFGVITIIRESTMWLCDYVITIIRESTMWLYDYVITTIRESTMWLCEYDHQGEYYVTMWSRSSGRVLCDYVITIVRESTMWACT